jgi:hypothetical protein
LTTVLAHSSGEWISSEWPVCQITDIASAQRMGAALTYARRYALFTLVGIAGEDDLDAPDLSSVAKAEVGLPPVNHRGNSVSSAKAVLPPDQSVTLRERLVAELSAINFPDDAAAWAHRNLPVKNSLTAGDAQIVEARFQARLATIGDGVSAEGMPNAIPNERVLSAERPADARQKTSTKPPNRRAALRALGKTVRLRDEKHRKSVSRQPCLVCGRVPSDSHHITFTQPRALGDRVSDEFTVPVCRIHHRELHRSGNEVEWWQKLNIDPVPIALKLWQHSHADIAATPMRDGVAQAPLAKTPGISVQDQSDRSHDAHADPASTGRKMPTES